LVLEHHYLSSLQVSLARYVLQISIAKEQLAKVALQLIFQKDLLQLPILALVH